eukprot:1052906-Prorocentrum_minimum.AAC.1
MVGASRLLRPLHGRTDCVRVAVDGSAITRAPAGRRRGSRDPPSRPPPPSTARGRTSPRPPPGS